MSDQENHGVGHIVPIRILAATAIALLVFTVITVWVAKYDFGALNVWVALGIATVKASLVVMIFMHLAWDRAFNGLVFISSLVFLALFISFALTDTLEYKPEMVKGNAVNVQAELDQLPARVDEQGSAGHDEGHD